MNKVWAFFLLLAGFSSCKSESNSNIQELDANQPEKVVLAIHGGAGTILPDKMTPEKEQEFREKLEESLRAGYQLIQEGSSSLDAVVAAIQVMENSPLFNAGKGAVFTNQGKNELDASIMEGKDLNAGAVAGVTNVKNPILAARAVMEKSEHVMMVGRGAELFSQEIGLEIVDPSYFWTEHRWEALQNVLKRDQSKMELDHDAKPESGNANQGNKTSQINQKDGLNTSKKSQMSPNSETDFIPAAKIDEKFGTVGAVALDKSGNLAAGTSTGGMTNKKYGRVGDAPIIGAGTYANNQTVAISCTGWGEFFIRSIAAYEVSAKMQYANMDVKKASQEVIDEIGEMGGNGGLIALDKNGQVSMPFNTAGMYRGFVTEKGEITIEIFK